MLISLFTNCFSNFNSLGFTISMVATAVEELTSCGNISPVLLTDGLGISIYVFPIYACRFHKIFCEYVRHFPHDRIFSYENVQLSFRIIFKWLVQFPQTIFYVLLFIFLPTIDYACYSQPQFLHSVKMFNLVEFPHAIIIDSLVSSGYFLFFLLFIFRPTIDSAFCFQRIRFHTPVFCIRVSS